jgi:hypothetical protein
MAMAHAHLRPAQPAADDVAPLIAGAHARGMFDAFEILGQGAILLDAQGRTLAVTGAATRRLGATLALCGRRPVAGAAADDSRLRRAIRDSLDGMPAALEIGTGAAELSLRLLPMPADPNQLLAAILLIDSARDGLRAQSLASFGRPRGALATH